MTTESTAHSVFCHPFFILTAATYYLLQAAVSAPLELSLSCSLYSCAYILCMLEKS